MPRATRSRNYEDVSSDTSVTSTASSRLAKATQRKNHKLPVGAIAEATPLEVVNEVPVVPKKVPPHPPVHHIRPPDLANSIKAPAPDVLIHLLLILRLLLIRLLLIWLLLMWFLL